MEDYKKKYEDALERARKLLLLKWIEKEFVDTGRVGAMYCFKLCDINRN